MPRIGILTGGGDCPGLNGVIRGIVRRGLTEEANSFVGFRYGWAGVLDNNSVELDRRATSGILPRGGTILGSSRTNPYADGADGSALVAAALERAGVDVLIPIGGDDTLGVAQRLHDAGIPVIGVPKTIDNDLGGTDMTFGFQTAVQIVSDAIDRLHTTAESHNRVMIVEVMGRGAGWIAAHAGMSGGADAILVPERPFDTEALAAQLARRHARGRSFSILVASEGATPIGGGLQTRAPTVDAFGHERLGGIGAALEVELERLTGYESRATILGHIQRGGTPVAFDRVLATRFGVAAMNAAASGHSGTMVSLRGTDIVEVPLGDALKEPKLLDPALYTRPPSCSSAEEGGRSQRPVARHLGPRPLCHLGHPLGRPLALGDPLALACERGQHLAYALRQNAAVVAALHHDAERRSRRQGELSRPQRHLREGLGPQAAVRERVLRVCVKAGGHQHQLRLEGRCGREHDVVKERQPQALL